MTKRSGKEVARFADVAMYEAEPLEAAEGPKVYVLAAPADPLGSIAAAAMMYEGKVVRDLTEVTDEERRHYFSQLQKTKLKAPFEFVNFHFLVENVHRGLTHQMVRQRTAVFCLSGDTQVFTVRKNRRYTLAELYNKWPSGPLSRMKIRTATDSGLVVYRKIRNVTCSGTKPVYELKTHDRRAIKASSDHLFWRPDGTFTRLGDLSVGEEVVSNGVPVGFKHSEQSKANMRAAPRSKWSEEAKAAFSEWCKENRGKQPDTWQGKDVGHRLAQHLYSGKRELGCWFCQASELIELAHMDGNPLNNEDSNVLPLCVPCHRAYDQGGYPMRTYPTRITSIEPVGEELTYDLEMDGEYARFVANGLVVHNSQESMRFAVKTNFAGSVHKPPSLSALPQDHPWNVVWERAVGHAASAYDALIAAGMPAEEARGLVPTNISTRLHYATNLRNLLDHAGNRLCTQAQFEWRTLWLQFVQAIRADGENHYYDRPMNGGTYRANAGWQYDLIADLFRPVCYLTGKCEFAAMDLDRACKIRDRVDAFAAHNVPSSEWAAPHDNLLPINPVEWLADPSAARVRPNPTGGKA